MKIKRIFMLLLVIVAMFAFTACSSKEIYNAGTYEGEGQGHGGAIVVSVTVTESKIESVVIDEFNDSEFAVEPANKLVSNIIKENSAEVDVIAGATATSKGVLDAVKAALSGATK